MVCLGLEPGAAGWKAQTNPLSYGGTPKCHARTDLIQFCARNMDLASIIEVVLYCR